MGKRYLVIHDYGEFSVLLIVLCFGMEFISSFSCSVFSPYAYACGPKARL